jgi:hypothetical protein
MKQIIILSSVLILSSCGNQKSRVFKKQRSESDIKISSLNLQTGEIKTRFQYQSYVEKKLEKLDCDIQMSSSIEFKISQSPNIQLGAFSKETIEFQINDLINHSQLKDKDSISYQLNCQIVYDKGGEYLRENSVLYISPNSKILYR